MGCVFSKANRGPPPPHVLYCRLPEARAHSHMLEHVDMKKLTKLIRSGRLAPLYPPDVEQADVMEECPICTMSYPSMNTASCCSARVCTECFVYHQTSSDPPGKAQCPFCKNTPFAVRYLGSKPKEQLLKEQQEQLSVKQARRRLKLQQDVAVTPSTPSTPAADTSSLQHTQEEPQAATPTAMQLHHVEQQQHSWLDELSSPNNNNNNNGSSSSSRRIENIAVYAGYHHHRHRSSSSSGGSTAADTGVQQDIISSTPRTAAAAASVAAAVAAAAASAGGLDILSQHWQQQQQHQGYELQQQYSQSEQQQQHDRQHNHEQQQHQQHEQEHEQQFDASRLLELQLQQLSELRTLHEAGLLPGYAAEQLYGLRLEELDEILLEQAIMESMGPHQRTAAVQA